MSRVVVCAACGARSTLRSQFEEECPECGSQELLEEDAYEESTVALRCAECGREVDGAPPGSEVDEESGRHTVDDICPLCGLGDLVPIDSAPSPRLRAEATMARAAARRLLERQTEGAVPTDVQALAEAAGLTIKRGPFPHDGMLVGGVIEVPEGDPRTERFVIAHELGHHELRHRVPEDKLEQEANAFASEVLIPRESLRAAVNAGESFPTLCRRFQVNKQPMVYALQGSRLLNQVRIG